MAARGARGWVGLLPGGVLLALALLASGAGAAAAQAAGPRADGAAAEECGAPAGGGTFDTPYWRDMHNSYGDGRFNRTLKYRNGYSVEVYDTAERLECSESWVNIPGVNLWNYEFQGFVYLCALIYCFLGIQIISDVFMSAVEVITASEKTVTINDTEFTVHVWNPTVANLTLMALGSSAPEILLSVIETGQNLGSKPGELGPSTIVGSAAFNLLMITAVCVVGLPAGESKSVSQFHVFAVTAVWSLWAYVWLYIVLQAWTPGEVTIAEAIITCIYMPLFVFMSYAQDRDWWGYLYPVPEKDEGDEDGLDGSGDDDSQHGSVKSAAYGLEHIVGVKKGTSFAEPDKEQPAVNKGEVLGMLRMLEKDESEAQAVEKKLKPTQSFITRRLDSITKAMKKKFKKYTPNSLFYKMNVRRRLAGKTHQANIGGEHEDTLAEILKSKTANHLEATTPPSTGSKRDRSTSAAHIGRRPSATSIGSTSTPRKGSTPISSDSVSLTVDHTEDDPNVEPVLIDFTAEEVVVLESGGEVVLHVSCSRVPRRDIAVHYKTIDGIAKAGQKYELTEGTVTFPKDTAQLIQSVRVPIIDNDLPEPNMHFFVQLSLPDQAEAEAVESAVNEADVVASVASETKTSAGNSDVARASTESASRKVRPHVVLGPNTMARVEILDDDDPGVFEFTDRLFVVAETAKFATIMVHRVQGCAGECSVDYFCTPGSARAGQSFVPTSGTLKFEAEETNKTIEVQMLPFTNDGAYEERSFHVILRNPTGLATLGRLSTAIVKIVEDASLADLTDSVNEALNAAATRYALPRSQAWADQFKEAVVMGAGIGDDGKPVEFEFGDYLLHFLSIFWKVLFAFVPPTEIWGGWATFWASLLMIAGVTAVVSEFASLFGCAVGMKDSVTAITFVALGTSLPDTFASKQAACEADDADAAIGNVTGSNSVNVFLGLGIPWLIGTLYFIATNEAGGHYCVPAAGLAFSIVVFSCCAFACLVLLYCRRVFCGGELGGDTTQKWASGVFLGALWFFYVLMSSLKEYGHIPGISGEEKTYDRFGCSCDMSWSSCGAA